MAQLRDLVPADLPRLAELEQVLFPTDSPWSEAIFAAELASPFTRAFGVVNTDNVLVGYCLIALRGTVEDAEFELLTIGVDPSEQGQGLGKLLLDTAVEFVDRHHAPFLLEVRTDNVTAIRLYESRGFVEVGLRKQYYQPSGADAFVMLRQPSVS
ncbi:ribosomal-protein-alanine N-acetyltransferase [Corynebacterium choanae]|uniref:[Ribosomal protein bS18]-alanine N-acetyltransferase n=2 Tax=Corynebacterium choanae TaxID=1862358 RepID=A0A3G6JB66_9CORY|nr:ribosomal-protein-alanine N-acetyltransferase [Corynebacterium choanae]